VNTLHPDPVAEYYNRNTLRFLRYGPGRQAAAIHRPVWGPGVKTAEEAALFSNRLVAAAIRPALGKDPSTAIAVDLGCGVGGTATWIANELGISVTGITNSPVQAELAIQRAQQLGLDRRCHFILGDFLAPPPLAQAQAAWAIESLAHASDPGLFFAANSALIVQGGRLVVCDDFLAKPIEQYEADPGALEWILRFQRDWHVPGLQQLDALVEIAGQKGFQPVSSTDLTPWLRGFHPLMLQLILLLTRLPLRNAFWQNLSGGAALQVCLRSGWTKYLALVLEKI
jgi:SAM-dependent methyltransferase